MGEQAKTFPVRSRLEEAIDGLNHRSRRVIELWLDGRPQKEIANSLGLSERNVAVIRASAVRQLRERIASTKAPKELSDAWPWPK